MGAVTGSGRSGICRSHQSMGYPEDKCARVFVQRSHHQKEIFTLGIKLQSTHHHNHASTDPRRGVPVCPVKSPIELIVLVGKIESAKLLIICTTGLSQLMVAAG